MPLVLQAKLPKAIEEGRVRRLGGTGTEPVDVWVLAATSEDVPALVGARRFREDLYHRLAVVTLRLPPLRERGSDVARLAAHFIERACRDYGIPAKTLADDARVALEAYPWPGNVRELGNVMERVALLSDAPRVSAAVLDLPSPRGPARGEGEPRAALEAGVGEARADLEAALQAEAGNLSRAAARLSVARNTLRYRLEKLGLRPGARRAPAAPPPSVGAPSAPLPVRWAERRVTVLRAALVPGAAEVSATEADRLTAGVIEKMRSFGGRILTLDGHDVTAAFGVEPIDDGPRRAAHAALVIRQTAGRLRDRAGDLPLRMALHTELVRVSDEAAGPVLDPGGLQAVQTTVAQQLIAAGPREIAVSPAATAFLRRRFALATALGPAGPAVRLVGPSDPERERTDLVGRARELRVLVELFEQTAAGQARAVTIVGEPGIGKSRLLRELHRTLAGRAEWVEGRVVSGARAMPLAPLVDLLHRTLGIDDVDSEPVIVAKLARRVLSLGEGLRPLLPFLRYLLSVDPGEPGVAAMDPTVRRGRRGVGTLGARPAGPHAQGGRHRQRRPGGGAAGA